MDFRIGAGVDEGDLVLGQGSGDGLAVEQFVDEACSSLDAR